MFFWGERGRHYCSYKNRKLLVAGKQASFGCVWFDQNWTTFPHWKNWGIFSQSRHQKAAICNWLTGSTGGDSLVRPARGKFHPRAHVDMWSIPGTSILTVLECFASETSRDYIEKQNIHQQTLSLRCRVVFILKEAVKIWAMNVGQHVSVYVCVCAACIYV